MPLGVSCVVGEPAGDITGFVAPLVRGGAPPVGAAARIQRILLLLDPRSGASAAPAQARVTVQARVTRVRGLGVFSRVPGEGTLEEGTLIPYTASSQAPLCQANPNRMPAAALGVLLGRLECAGLLALR